MSKRKGDRTINFDTAFHKALDVLSYLIFISVQGILQVHTPDKYSLRQKFSDIEENSIVMWLFRSFSKIYDFQRQLKTE